MMAAAAGMQAVGAIQSSRSQAAGMNYQAQVADAQAAATRGQAQIQADQAREVGRLQVSQTRSALAGAGVRVDQGSGLLVQGDVTRRAERDALSAILSGDMQARGMEAEAAGMRAGAKNARRAGNLAAVTSVLSAGANYAQWGASMPKPGGGGGWVSGYDLGGR